MSGRRDDTMIASAASEDERSELLEYTTRTTAISKNGNEPSTMDGRLLSAPATTAVATRSMSSNNRPSPEQQSDQEKGQQQLPPDTSTTTTATAAAAAPQSPLTQKKSRKRRDSSTSPTRRLRGGASHNLDAETDVIGDLVGHFGRWQLMMTLLISLFQVPNTFHIISPVYQSAKKEYWCKRPPTFMSLNIDEWRDASHSHNNCHFLESFSNMINETTMITTNLINCNEWEYDSRDNVGNTWVSEWNLVCDKEHLISVAEMVFLLGVATGGIVSGYLSDRFGRKRMLFISASLQTVIALSLCFAKSFNLYITLRCLLGLASVAVTYSALILAIECVDGKWRTLAGMYNLFPLPISYMIISGIAYLTQDFRKLQLCTAIPGIFLLLLWFVVPESPRWLLVKGRTNDVSKVVQSIAKFNKQTLPPNYESLLVPPTQEDSPHNFIWLFKSPYLRRITLCFLCIWFTINLVYYGIILNMNTFGGNVYVNSALAGLVEIPAIAIAMYIITKVGKKWLFCATLIGGGIACSCAAIVESDHKMLWLKITFLMFGKFTISAGNTIMPVYTAELYPTVIRNAGVGACNVSAGVALILTPYLSHLNDIKSYLMMVVLACWSLFGGFIILFLPESAKLYKEENEK